MPRIDRLRVVLLTAALACSACTQTQPVRTPYYGDPYYEPYYGGSYGIAYPVWRSDVDIQVDKARNSIDNGIDKGSLTRDEAQALRGELKTILHNVERMQNDGRLDPRERESIKSDLDRLQRDIRREKDDDERRRRR